MKRKDFFDKAFKYFSAKGMSLVEENPIKEIMGELSEELSEESGLSKHQLLEGEERPPGALEPDSLFREKCTGCDECMIACPVDVVEVNDLDARYPIIFSKKAPCIHCEDTPCIKVCPTEALSLESLVRSEVDN